MNSKEKAREKRAIQKINTNLRGIDSHCKTIVKKYHTSDIMSHKDYIFFVFSADILYKIKDIIFLNKKLKEAKNNFDGSLSVLARSVLEAFIYLKYLISEEDKITMRLHAFICHTSGNNIGMFNSIKSLGVKKKFIFDIDQDSITSLQMINKKLFEWGDDIKNHKNYQKGSITTIEKEISILKKVEEVAKEYDKILGINTIKEGSESDSLEWMYNYLYRFLSMSTHQNLNDKEEVFGLYGENKNEPNNLSVLSLMEDISGQILALYK